ncbi:acetyl/propionyl/methylcrotonyl-CoA carboxylase subunit alpha [Devosia sp.]|uniref:acetyl/propionyl/methylcrotonyl-CoA carboxylase subunit alpha n=1 Tax=Devosia sp. TaxID=1871048 RepID=UPI002FC6A629
MFKTILIANRGEIACRVIRTAKRLGIRTVAVYSDADAGALHVALADEAHRIGAAPASQSYLRGDAVIEAALASGAQAIHPGYGFLSENADFAEAVAAAGLVFIGPSAAAIRAMGLKDAAKALMQEAGVPVVPGYHGASQDVGVLAAEAERIGYPVLIKARAGGGGKGMRRVDDPRDFAEALAGAQREGLASFGDSHCLIETYVAHPRHIEVQVFGDSHGNVVHLFERDCSLQRRHQKVIEEAPAPGMTAEMREAMGAAAVRAAKAIGYSGAGTVEFIVDARDGLRPDRFYFMEMNTRLQVEHPVTEFITGLDLVELQLRVAAGEGLPFGQHDLTIDGWAFEARIYAEDAARDFLPAPGTLGHLRLPETQAAVRVDSGVRQGDAITTHYDPLIAKLIVHGPDRAAALNRLRGALARCQVAGTVTNLAFLAALTADADLASGDVDTGLIARKQEALVAPPDLPDVAVALAALTALQLPGKPDPDPWGARDGRRAWGKASHQVTLHGDTALPVAVTLMPGSYEIEARGRRFRVTLPSPGRLSLDGVVTDAEAVRVGNAITIFTHGAAFTVQLHDPLDGEAEDASTADHVISPMPGAVRAVLAAPGQRVGPGEALLVVEAMKMEYTLRAPRTGQVADVLVNVGDQVDQGAVLLNLTPEA